MREYSELRAKTETSRISKRLQEGELSESEREMGKVRVRFKLTLLLVVVVDGVVAHLCCKFAQL